MGLLFESEVCGRCGGSGSYSFNQVDGSVCYGCGGRKERLTKRGSAAQAFFNELSSKPVMELKLGDKVKGSGMTMGGRSTYSYFAPVVELDLEPKANGYSIVNGVRKDSIYVKYVTEHSKLGRCGHHVSPDHVVRLKLEGEEREAAIAKALAYQASLTKAGKPRK